MLLQLKTFFHHRTGGLATIKRHGSHRAFLCLLFTDGLLMYKAKKLIEPPSATIISFNAIKGH